MFSEVLLMIFSILASIVWLFWFINGIIFLINYHSKPLIKEFLPQIVLAWVLALAWWNITDIAFSGSFIPAMTSDSAKEIKSTDDSN